jgi:hypothetical protein
MGRITEHSIIAANKAIATGLRKHFPANKAFYLRGKRWTVKKLLATLADEEAQLAARKRAHAAWLAVSRSVRETVNANHKLRLEMRLVIGSALGRDSAKCAEFGFVFREHRKPTQAVAVAAAEKRRATRAARGTMGKRQREKLKRAAATIKSE